MSETWVSGCETVRWRADALVAIRPSLKRKHDAPAVSGSPRLQAAAAPVSRTVCGRRTDSPRAHRWPASPCLSRGQRGDPCLAFGLVLGRQRVALLFDHREPYKSVGVLAARCAAVGPLQRPRDGCAVPVGRRVRGRWGCHRDRRLGSVDLSAAAACTPARGLAPRSRRPLPPHAKGRLIGRTPARAVAMDTMLPWTLTTEGQRRDIGRRRPLNKAAGVWLPARPNQQAPPTGPARPPIGVAAFEATAPRVSLQTAGVTAPVSDRCRSRDARIRAGQGGTRIGRRSPPVRRGSRSRRLRGVLRAEGMAAQAATEDTSEE